jgi:hypothetical protein
MVWAKARIAKQLLGGQGINLIERLANEMGFVWRPTATHDVGIDGEIEVRDPSSGRKGATPQHRFQHAVAC